MAYCQSSVFVVASIFGPKAVQAVMAGQAAVAVVVSLVELGSVAKVLHSAVVPTSKELERNGRTPEELSAFVCFAFSTCILGVSLAAHSWMLKTPAYKSLILPIELRLLAKSSRGHEERQSLLSSSVTSRRSSAFLQETTFERIVRVAKANVIYEVAIAYVFVITLVRLSKRSILPHSDLHFMCCSPSFLLSLHRFCRSTTGSIHSSSTHCTFSFSISAIFLDVTSVHSPRSSSGLPNDFLVSPSLTPFSFPS